MNATAPFLKPAKSRRCRNRECRATFIPAKPLQTVCGPLCAFRLIQQRKEAAKKRQDAAERREIRAKREKLKTRRDWINEAQKAFNSFVRERDKNLPCICCGIPFSGGMVGGTADAGHYRSTGSAPHLRFTENNCHAQRKQCNRYGAGRAVDYRIGLIARIGLEAVEALEADNEPRKWTIDQLKAIRDTYWAKLKELKARNV